MRYQILLGLFACAAVVARVSDLRAADIAFGAPQHAVSEAADFQYMGTLDRAYALGATSNVDAGGITFVPFASNSHGDSTTLSGPTAFSPKGVSGNYATLLSHGLSFDGGPASITFNNLIPGVTYTAGVIGMGLRARSDCCSAGAGYNNLFVSGDSPSGGSPVTWDTSDATSQNLRGTFIAGASGRQTINFNLYGTSGFDPLTVSANINAVVLSYAAVPEPGTVWLTVIGLCGALAGLRKRC